MMEVIMKFLNTILTASLLAASQLSLAAAPTPQEVLATVEKSPAAVAIKDKQAWLDLFYKKSIIEDPVGTAPHIRECPDANSCDTSKHSAFWETFIAPNTIIFHVKEDIIAGNEIVRDLDIETHLSSGVSISVPTYLTYKVIRNENNELKVQSLAAHWEVIAMVGQVLGKENGLKAGAGLSLLMLQEQGLGGALGYMNGLLFGMFEEGKWKANGFANAINNGSDFQLKSLFHFWNGQIEYPVAGNTLSLDEFKQLGGNIDLQLSDLRSAGFYTSGRFTLNDNGQQRSGVVFFKFDEWTRLMTNVRFFWND